MFSEFVNSEYFEMYQTLSETEKDGLFRIMVCEAQGADMTASTARLSKIAILVLKYLRRIEKREQEITEKRKKAGRKNVAKRWEYARRKDAEEHKNEGGEIAQKNVVIPRQYDGNTMVSQPSGLSLFNPRILVGNGTFPHARTEEEDIYNISLSSSSARGKKSKTGEKKKPARQQVFNPPTITEVDAYLKAQGYTTFSAFNFCHFYDNCEWRDAGGRTIRTWKSLCDRWEAKNIEKAASLGIWLTAIPDKRAGARPEPMEEGAMESGVVQF